MATTARFTLLVLFALGPSLYGPAALAAPQWAKDLIEDRISERLKGRTVEIGEIDVDWGFPLGLELQNVRIGNADWAQHETMFAAERVALQLGVGDLVLGNLDMQRVEMDQPLVHLARQADGTSNWSVLKSEKEQKDDDGFKPESLQVKGGRVIYDDNKLGAQLTMNVSTGGEPGSDQRTLQVAGDGRFRDRPLSFTATGGPPSQALDDGTPYAVEASGTLGQIDFRLDGKARDLMRLDGLQAEVALTAPDSARLPKPLADSALQVPGFQLQAQVSRDGPRWALRELNLSAGQTRLDGSLVYERGETPRLDVQLAANQLDLNRWGVMDLLQARGDQPEEGDGDAAAEEAPAEAGGWQQQASDLLQPLRRYRGVADVEIGELRYGDTQLTDLVVKGQLQDASLQIERLHAVQDQGEISAEGALQFGAGPLTGQVTARVEQFDLGEAAAPFGFAQLGTLDGELHTTLKDDRLVIRDSQLAYDAPAQDLSLQARLRTSPEGSMLAEGSGTRNGEPFQFDLTLGRPLDLLSPADPFPVKGSLASQGTTLWVDGTVTRPLRLGQVNARFELDGDNPGQLRALTGFDLPDLPPYRAEGTLSWDEPLLKVQDLDARLAESDVRGDIRLRMEERPMLWATLYSRQLRLRDARPLREVAVEPRPDPTIFQDEPFKVGFLRQFDARIDYRADDLVAKDIPLQGVRLEITLDQGVLAVEPLRLGVGGGQATGQLTLNAHESPVDASLDLSIRQVNLKPLLRSADFPQIAQDSAGIIGGEVHVQGSGDSVDTLMADLDGNLELAMSDGYLDMLVIELLGLDAGEALVGYLAKSDQVPMQCAYVRADIDSGLAQLAQLFVATSDSNVTGSGIVNLDTEALDVRLEAHPKDFSVLSSDSPILIQGALGNPQVSVLTGELLARGVASVVGAIIAPPLAILPWVEPGLGEGSGMGCEAAMQAFREDQARE